MLAFDPLSSRRDGPSHAGTGNERTVRVGVADVTRRELARAGGFAVLAMALARGAPACANPPSARGLNVVVIVIDSLRADHLGCYGAYPSRTPSLDALARESLRFTTARPEALPTIPARRAIMTGRRSFPFRGWRPTKDLPKQPGWQPIRRSEAIFTDELAARGYTTGYVTDNPHVLTAAYDSFRARFDRPGVVEGQAPARGRRARRVPSAELRRNVMAWQRGTFIEHRIREYLEAAPRRRRAADYNHARVFKAAAAWVSEVRSQQPFALVVDCFDPHEPWDPPLSQLRRRQAQHLGVRPIQPFRSPGARVRERELPRAALGAVHALYEAEVESVDRWLGAFLERLDDFGLARQTVLVLLSDHGVLLGERGWIGKPHDQLHRELTEIPFLIRDPAGRRAGEASRYPASTHDVAPTLLSMLGVAVPERMQGADLSPLLTGDAPPLRRHWTAAYDGHVAASDGRWLLIANSVGKKRRLYDTHKDTAELDDVADQHPRAAERLWQLVLEDAGGPLPRYQLG